MKGSSVPFAPGFLAGGLLVAILAVYDTRASEAVPEEASGSVSRRPRKAAASAAQETPGLPRLKDLKIGIVNLKDCFDKEKYRHVRDLENEMNERLEELKKELESLDKEITAIREKMRDVPPDFDLFQDLRQKLVMKQAQYRAKKDVGETELRELTRKYRGQIYDEVMLVIGRVAKELDLDIVFKADAPPSKEDVEKRGSVEMKMLYRAVLYHSEKLDITKTVLEKLNADYEARRKKRFKEDHEKK